MTLKIADLDQMNGAVKIVLTPQTLSFDNMVLSVDSIVYSNLSVLVH